MKRSAGFTLIELVVVIVLLGILAAVAVPKFTGLSVDARNAAAKGVAGAVASGSGINYGSYVAKGATATTATGLGVVSVTGANAAVCTHTVLEKFVSGGVVLVDSGAEGNNTFNVSGGSGDCAGGGTTLTCNITAPNDGSTAPTAAPVTMTCTS